MHAMLLECPEPLSQIGAGRVETLKDGLEALFGDGFHSHQRALDAGPAHRVEKLRVFTGFHRDLCEKDHVVGKLGYLVHHLEPLRAHRFQFRDTSHVGLLLGELNVGQGNGIEVIVRKRDEAKSEAPQLHDLFDHHIRGTLPRLLSVGTPHRTERTMFRATAHGLHGGPHVTIARSKIPTRGQELIPRNPSTVINSLGRASSQIGDRLRPHDISVSLDDGMSAAQLKGLFRIQGCVDATIDHPGSAFPRLASDLHASQGVAGMDADAHYVAGLYAVGLNLFERLVGDEGIAVLGRSRGGKYIQPTRRDHADSERSITGIDQMNVHRCSPPWALFFLPALGFKGMAWTSLEAQPQRAYQNRTAMSHQVPFDYPS